MFKLSCKQTSANSYTVASAAFLFVPTLMSVYTQSMPITLTFAFSTVFSTLYHTSNEESYGTLDVIWANIAMFLALIMLGLIAVRYGVFHWRVMLPFIFGAAAISLYFFHGYADDGVDPNNLEHYELYHSLWHLFLGLAAIAIVITPVDISDASNSYWEMIRKTPGKGNASHRKWVKAHSITRKTLF